MLLLDGDIFVYRVGWACESEPVGTACRILDGLLAAALCEAGDELEGYVLYLSGPSSENFRHLVVDDYKANRKGGKPKHYDALRDYMVDKWDATVSIREEADDLIAQAWYLEPDATIVSIDKDFYQLHGRHYDPVKHTVREVGPDSALFNLYTQAMVGDRVDNIKGIDGVGPVKAAAAVHGCETEQDYWTATLTKFGGDEQRLIDTLRLVYLRRIHNEWFVKPEDRTHDTSTGNPTGAMPPPPSIDEQGYAADWDAPIPTGRGVSR